MPQDIRQKTPIRSFRDLEVYQNTYEASILVMTKIVPKLPDSEKYDLKDQLSRSCKAPHRLIAEGYAKKHQKAGFQKYIDDAMAEANETSVSLCQCRDIYGKFINIKLCEDLIEEYDVIGKQLYNLEKSWERFSNKPKPKD